MVSNIMPCCIKCFNPNQNIYVQVTNFYVHYIYMNLQYTLYSQLINRQSPVFKPGTFQRLTFPSNAVGLLLRVFDVSPALPKSIGVSFISDATTTCFNVTGQSVQTSSLVEVPC